MPQLRLRRGFTSCVRATADKVMDDEFVLTFQDLVERGFLAIVDLDDF